MKEPNNFIYWPRIDGYFTIFKKEWTVFNYFAVALYIPYLERNLYDELREECYDLTFHFDTKMKIYTSKHFKLFVIKILGFGLQIARQNGY